MIEQILNTLRAAIATPVVVQAPQRDPDGLEHSVFVREGDAFRRVALPGPKAQGAAHTFHDLRDFAEFVNRRAGDLELLEEVDVVFGSGRVRAGFDPDSLAAVVVDCRLRNHPMWEAWTRVFGRDLNQRELHEHLVAFGDAIVTANPDAPGPADELVSGLASLEIVRGGSFASHLGAGGYVKLQAQESKQDFTVNLPTRWFIRVPRYEGILVAPEGVAWADLTDKDPADLQEASYEVGVMLRIDVGGDGKPSFRLSAPSLPLVEAEAERDVGAYLRFLLDERVYVGHGEYRTELRQVQGK